jgi:carbamoyl-phosphate synthase large subunit
MKKSRVLVTNVQSSLSQTLLKSLSALNEVIEIVGLSSSKAIFPSIHFCDFVEYVDPLSYYSEKDQIIQVCEKYSVKLIILTLESDTVVLKRHQKELPFILCSEAEVNNLFLDKLLTWEYFSSRSIPFCRTILPSKYNSSFAKSTIAKPRLGCNSKGIVKNPTDPQEFSDDTYIIQELLEGIEFTAAFYVTKEHSLHSLIVFEREFIERRSIYSLNHEYNDQIKAIIQPLINDLALIGPINLQAFVVEGKVIPIEINARFSSSNYIRSRFGFKDVEWSIKEYLLNESLEKPKIANKGAAITIRSDIIYPDISASEINEKSIFEF